MLSFQSHSGNKQQTTINQRLHLLRLYLLRLWLHRYGYGYGYCGFSCSAGHPPAPAAAPPATVSPPAPVTAPPAAAPPAPAPATLAPAVAPPAATTLPAPAAAPPVAGCSCCCGFTGGVRAGAAICQISIFRQSNLIFSMFPAVYV